jgi:hypothetical protein
MAEDCSAGFAIMPIIFIFIFISILSRALRGATRMGGGHSGYGGGRYRTFGSGGLALAYLAQQGSYRSSYSSYNPPYTAPSSYRSQPYTQTYTQPNYNQPSFPQSSYNQPSYGQPAYAQPQQYQQSQPSYPSYSSGQYGSGLQGAPAPAYAAGQTAYTPPAPAPEGPKVSCNYCGSLNPSAERNCLLCGAPIK